MDVAGSANNVLAWKKCTALKKRRAPVRYCAGGDNVANELEGYNRDRATNQVSGIYDIVMDIFRIAETEGITTQKAANTLAERRIVSMGRIKHTFTGVQIKKRQRGSL